MIVPLPRIEATPTRENAQGIAYQRIKDWIINGPLEAGEAIRDVEVALMLGVSRTPVREALIRLSQENLVSASAGRSTRVAELDFSRAADAYTMGGVLDGYAAETAAAMIDGAALERMRHVLDAMDGEVDDTRLPRLDEEFHGIYHAVVGNPVLIEMMQRINTQTRRIERAAFREPQIRREAHQEHVALWDALTARDPAAAKEAALTNWGDSWARIHAALELANTSGK